MRLLGTLRRRWFAVVLAVMFLQQLAIMALRPMTSYRALELGAGPAGLGLVAGSFAAAAVICAVPVGRLIDRHGEGRFAVAGIAALGAAGFASAFAPNLAALVAVQAAMGLAHLANMVALQTMLANAEDDLGSAERFGRFTVVASLGQLAGPALAGLVAGGGTRAGFILGSVAALLGAVVAVPLWSAHRRSPRTRAPARLPVRSLLAVPTMKQAMLASLVVLAGVDLLVVYLPAYGHEAGLSVRTVGFLLALRAAFSLLARVALGQLAARLPTRRLLLYCLVIPAAAYAVLPLTGNPLPLALLLALVGFWLGAATPLTMAWVSDLAPLGARGTVMAVRISGNRLGQTVLPIAAGAAATVTGVGGIFWGLTGLLVLAAGSLLWTPGDAVDEAAHVGTAWEDESP